MKTQQRHYSGKKSGGVTLKKSFGQHFLRDHSIVENIVGRVKLDAETSVFEIGCGDGFLTEAILKKAIARLWVFEIDPEWATVVRKKFPDNRLTIFREDILIADFTRLEPHKPWILLANLPYQITFPILHLLERNTALLKEGVIMVQEEVAQKIVATTGRGYGLPSLFFQHAFEWELMGKIPPGAFFPPPQVFSRLLHFTTRAQRDYIPDEPGFWKFIKVCFSQPRRMLKNNLLAGGYPLSKLSEETLQLRAQQMNKAELLQVWELVRTRA
ncbi:TPA: ribosomal RNA small subunit methyltransferase A [Candidatus Dependentiae bacterium]|nr:MAG: Ribosomal RNA small subunit methyltransferase A [candidate division TM6 bacterium GW2011_GWF2_43_87]HBL98526.1 ribosomal RNA small subunit methyltransferase A [Candidatus Dependentiae bacterium]